MAKKRAIYTTSEYLDALEAQTAPDGRIKSYQCKGKEVMLFPDPKSADMDAQWYVDFWKRDGKKVRKPRVYRIKLERV